METLIKDQFEEITVCPYCDAPTQEKFSGDEGLTFCSDGCGCLEGESPVHKFLCTQCGELCNEQECTCSKVIQYKGYSIEKDYRNPYAKEPEFMFYPTSEGIQHDGDYDDGWKYCGNCKWESSLENAKEAIDEITE